MQVDGAMAFGLISKEAEDAKTFVYRCSLTVRSADLETRQISGPKFFRNERQGREWIIREASYHGFAEGQFNLEFEE